MELSLKPTIQQQIEVELRSGSYGSLDELVQAALFALQQQKNGGEFLPGELEKLIQEGERSIKNEGTIPAAEVFSELRRRGQKHRRNRKAG